MSAHSTIERTVWIAAPPERVWAAVCQPEHLAHWFLPPSMGADVIQDANGTLYVSFGPMNIEMALVEAADPPNSVVLRSSPDHLITAAYHLSPENDGTRLTVTIAGFEALSGEARREQMNPTGAAWDKALANLTAYLSGQRLPFPEGWVAALFGYRVESADLRAVERSIWIDAPREHVWEALVDLKQMEQWFSPGTSWTATGTGVGARFFVYDEEAGSENYGQTIDVFQPPLRLVTRSDATPSQPAYITDWTLEPANGGTRLKITYSGYEREGDVTRHDSMEQNAFGFGVMLQNIKAHVEGQPLPNPGGF